jgi:hypothetical protein
VPSDEWIDAYGHGVTVSRCHGAPVRVVSGRGVRAVRSNLNEVERLDADTFARSELFEHAPYGFVTIVNIGLSLLTGLKFTVGVPGTTICWGLVAAALAAPQWREDQSPSLASRSG